MRTIILPIAIFLSSLITGICDDQSHTTNIKNGAIVSPANASTTTDGQKSRFDPAMQEMIDSWIKGSETNGISCAVFFTRILNWKLPPVCCVNLINDTTNIFYGGFRPSPEMLFEVELFDSNNIPVEKTDAGKRYGEPVSQEQLREWYNKNVNRHGWGTFALYPLSVRQQVSQFSLPEVFQLKEPGEYILHLHMRLMQRQQDSSGKLSFSINWLPEVVAKVRILPEDIMPTNLVPNAQTNPPVKGP
ncbi:MAG: hypothetical protein ABSF34_06105 [Verrucomicrobiota bacterium]|jgi:hypothetical protein